MLIRTSGRSCLRPFLLFFPASGQTGRRAWREAPKEYIAPPGFLVLLSQQSGGANRKNSFDAYCCEYACEDSLLVPQGDPGCGVRGTPTAR